MSSSNVKVVHRVELAEAEEEDPFDAMLKRSGCVSEEASLRDCMDEAKDWRKCQREVKVFQHCMEKRVQEKKQARQRQS